jgi:hypothetical protein
MGVHCLLAAAVSAPPRLTKHADDESDPHAGAGMCLEASRTWRTEAPQYNIVTVQIYAYTVRAFL